MFSLSTASQSSNETVGPKDHREMPTLRQARTSSAPTRLYRNIGNHNLKRQSSLVWPDGCYCRKVPQWYGSLSSTLLCFGGRPCSTPHRTARTSIQQQRCWHNKTTLAGTSLQKTVTVSLVSRIVGARGRPDGIEEQRDRWV